MRKKNKNKIKIKQNKQVRYFDSASTFHFVCVCESRFLGCSLALSKGALFSIVLIVTPFGVCSPNEAAGSSASIVVVDFLIRFLTSLVVVLLLLNSMHHQGLVTRTISKQKNNC